MHATNNEAIVYSMKLKSDFDPGNMSNILLNSHLEVPAWCAYVFQCV